MTQIIEQLRWLGNYLADDAESKGIGQGSEGARYCFAGAKTIEQLQARVAELEALLLEEGELHDNAEHRITELEAENAMLKDGKRSNIRLHQQLLLAQAEIKRLRDSLQTYIDEHEECQDADDWMAMMCSMEAHHVADEALSQPSDTSELNAIIRYWIRAGAEYAFKLTGVNEGLSICDEEIEDCIKESENSK